MVLGVDDSLGVALSSTHYYTIGISIVRKHSNVGREPHHTFTPKEVIKIITLILNYSKANAILLPGQIPGYKTYNLQLLPSSISKNTI